MFQVDSKLFPVTGILVSVWMSHCPCLLVSPLSTSLLTQLHMNQPTSLHSPSYCAVCFCLGVAVVFSAWVLCVMDSMFAAQLGIGLEPLAKPTEASALDGHPLWSMTRQTVPVHLGVSGNHHKTLTFHLTDLLRLPVIMGFPRLFRHSSHTDWSTGVILSWHRHAVYLGSALCPTPTDSSAYLCHHISYMPLMKLKPPLLSSLWPRHLPPPGQVSTQFYSLSNPKPQARRNTPVSPGSSHHPALPVTSSGWLLLHAQKRTNPKSLHQVLWSQHQIKK